jgi:hypothetical protein
MRSAWEAVKGVGHMALAVSETVTLGTLTQPASHVSSSAAIGSVILCLRISGVLYSLEVAPPAPEIEQGCNEPGEDRSPHHLPSRMRSRMSMMMIIKVIAANGVSSPAT